jgi:hypothetical protein
VHTLDDYTKNTVITFPVHDMGSLSPVTCGLSGRAPEGEETGVLEASENSRRHHQAGEEPKSLAECCPPR